tara:strand:- start:472 stop:708 length:237 start_codon:yes stop_codon:yes gene_type:complete
MARNEVFDFLNKLREGGTVNMFEAPRMMEAHFGYTPEEAKMNFYQWTQSLQRDEEDGNQEGTAQVNSGWSSKEDSQTT